METSNILRGSYQTKGQGETPGSNPRWKAELGAAYAKHSGHGLSPPVGHEEDLRSALGTEPQNNALVIYDSDQTGGSISSMAEQDPAENSKYAHKHTATDEQGHCECYEDGSKYLIGYPVELATTTWDGTEHSSNGSIQVDKDC